MSVTSFWLSKRFSSPTVRVRLTGSCLALWGMLWLLSACVGHPTASDRGNFSVQRVKVFLAAADYRRAIEECQRHVAEQPSARSYVALTYVYQALDAYVESLAKSDQWVAIELLALSLDSWRPENLLDSPDILARIAKELIQASARRQSDIAAAMAARLDDRAVARLWKEQQAWRTRHSDSWWLGMPEEWEPSGHHLTP